MGLLNDHHIRQLAQHKWAHFLVIATKPMTKSQITKALVEAHGLKQKACSEYLNSFVEIACAEVKKTGVFTVPGLCKIKTRTKAATKACTRQVFGKEMKVAAKPAKKICKAYPVAALKKQI